MNWLNFKEAKIPYPIIDYERHFAMAEFVNCIKTAKAGAFPSFYSVRTIQSGTVQFSLITKRIPRDAREWE